ncbi:cuticle protein AMP4-like [Panulirus ornatus]|uniref:cuticle protein AMP4-like n=1 Tax=Panulirus ornatus TaxID=150431 RepID=UPI003A8BEBA6
MNPVILFCLAAVAVAAPQFQEVFPTAQITVDERQEDANGSFNYVFEADNGIAVEASGTPGSQGQTNMQGSFRFPLPDGTIAEVRYVADENGFQPTSELLPSSIPPSHHVDHSFFIQQDTNAGFVFQ